MASICDVLTGEELDLLRGVNDNIHAYAVDSMLGHVVGDRLPCSKLELISADGEAHVCVKFRLAHDGLHYIEAADSLPLVSEASRGLALIDKEEEFLANLPQHNAATDTDKLRCYLMALLQLNKRDVRCLRETGHAILGACCRCNPHAVGPTTRNNIATLLRKWDYHPLFEGVLQRFSQD